MSRINLHVPIEEQDAAKKLGAKLDKKNNTWYTYLDEDTEMFFKWIKGIDESVYDLRSDHFYIAEANKKCYKCNKMTIVYTFLLDTFEYTYAIEEIDGNENFKTFWVQQSTPSFINNITALNGAAKQAMMNYTNNYHMKGIRYFGNHCDHCDALQGDYNLHVDPGGAFRPMDENDLKTIKLFKIEEPFFARGEYDCGDPVLEDNDVIKICCKKTRKPRTFGKLFKNFIT